MASYYFAVRPRQAHWHLQQLESHFSTSSQRGLGWTRHGQLWVCALLPPPSLHGRRGEWKSRGFVMLELLSSPLACKGGVEWKYICSMVSEGLLLKDCLETLLAELLKEAGSWDHMIPLCCSNCIGYQYVVPDSIQGVYFKARNGYGHWKDLPYDPAHLLVSVNCSLGIHCTCRIAILLP